MCLWLVEINRRSSVEELSFGGRLNMTNQKGGVEDDGTL